MHHVFVLMMFFVWVAVSSENECLYVLIPKITGVEILHGLYEEEPEMNCKDRQVYKRLPNGYNGDRYMYHNGSHWLVGRNPCSNKLTSLRIESLSTHPQSADGQWEKYDGIWRSIDINVICHDAVDSNTEEDNQHEMSLEQENGDSTESSSQEHNDEHGHKHKSQEQEHEKNDQADSPEQEYEEKTKSSSQSNHECSFIRIPKIPNMEILQGLYEDHDRTCNTRPVYKRRPNRYNGDRYLYHNGSHWMVGRNPCSNKLTSLRIESLFSNPQSANGQWEKYDGIWRPIDINVTCHASIESMYASIKEENDRRHESQEQEREENNQKDSTEQEHEDATKSSSQANHECSFIRIPKIPNMEILQGLYEEHGRTCNTRAVYKRRPNGYNGDRYMYHNGSHWLVGRNPCSNKLTSLRIESLSTNPQSTDGQWEKYDGIWRPIDINVTCHASIESMYANIEEENDRKHESQEQEYDTPIEEMNGCSAVVLQQLPVTSTAGHMSDVYDLEAFTCDNRPVYKKRHPITGGDWYLYHKYKYWVVGMFMCEDEYVTLKIVSDAQYPELIDEEQVWNVVDQKEWKMAKYKVTCETFDYEQILMMMIIGGSLWVLMLCCGNRSIFGYPTGCVIFVVGCLIAFYWRFKPWGYGYR